MRVVFLGVLALALGTARLPAETRSSTNALRIRIVAANLTSGTDQSYSPDNGNH